MTDDSHEEIISAALDGEAVSLDALRDALATGDGRKALASFVLLRAAVAADTIAPRAELPAVPHVVDTDVRTDASRSRWRLATGLASAAAVLLAVVSFWLGATWRAGVSSLGSDVQVRAHESATGSAGASEQVAAPSAPATPDQPPTPTRVLRFTPGVDWFPSS